MRDAAVGDAARETARETATRETAVKRARGRSRRKPPRNEDATGARDASARDARGTIGDARRLTETLKRLYYFSMTTDAYWMDEHAARLMVRLPRAMLHGGVAHTDHMGELLEHMGYRKTAQGRDDELMCCATIDIAPGDFFD